MLEVNSVTVPWIQMETQKKYIVSLAVLANRYKEYENFLVIFAVIVR